MNTSLIEDPTPESAERLQEQADIKSEEIAETPPASEQMDFKSLGLNETYAFILHQVKTSGPDFFFRANPDTFNLGDDDPLRLIWVNMLTAWHLSSTILTQFEASMLAAQATAEAEEAVIDVDATPPAAKDFDVVTDSGSVEVPVELEEAPRIARSSS